MSKAKPILRCGGIDDEGIRADCIDCKHRLAAVQDLRGPGIPAAHWMAPPMLALDEPCTDKVAA